MCRAIREVGGGARCSFQGLQVKGEWKGLHRAPRAAHRHGGQPGVEWNGRAGVTAGGACRPRRAQLCAGDCVPLYLMGIWDTSNNQEFQKEGEQVALTEKTRMAVEDNF